ncbi:MAG: formate-dependent phosphoribosylglycinamide formyltransferase [Oligoflexus sp.]
MTKTSAEHSGQRILLLGSGELGKELTIELMRLGHEVIACDRYPQAPAMLVANTNRVFNMLDGAALRAVVEEVKPDLIVPEIEAIATATLVELEAEGQRIIPTAEAARLTMDREGIRRLASEELDIPTARFRFADQFSELQAAAAEMGFPVVVKPIMSSSGKGQSIVRQESELQTAWEYSQKAGRAGEGRIIVEEFIDFDSEITLLTIRSKNGTHFCEPIGHRQEGGDYVESWQPHPMSEEQLAAAQDMAKKITDRLGGWGVFGVELFLMKDGRVLFSEVSPRPHDTGMVTLATQYWSEFALHARAILGYDIPMISRPFAGASVAIKATESVQHPIIRGLPQVFRMAGCDIRVFAKPEAFPGRRMAVLLAQAADPMEALQKALALKSEISIEEEKS